MSESDEKISILNKIGFRWISLILPKSKFSLPNDHSKDYYEDIKQKADQINEDNFETIYIKFDEFLKEDEERRKELDDKVSKLLGFAGIVSTILIGIIPYVLTIKSSNPFMRILFISILLLTVISLGISILLGLRSIKIGYQKFTSIVLEDLLSEELDNKNKIYKSLTLDTLKCYNDNRKLINTRAHYVRGAQDWFRNSVVLILILLLLVIGTLTILEPQKNNKTDTINTLIIVKQIDNKKKIKQKFIEHNNPDCDSSITVK